MRIELNPEVRSLLAQVAVRAAAADRRVWATGGIVRDALRGVGSRDIDLAIEGDSIEFGRNLADSVKGHFVILDKKRGHVRIVLDSPRAQIDMASLRAEVIEGDLEQRDYTINAIAVEVGEFAAGDLAEFIDPTRGQDDLASRTVKATSEAALQDDPVRLLRGVRLATELDFSVDESTAEMIRRNAGLIERTAAERVREELVKILATDQAAEGLRTMDALGLFAHVLPEMEVARGVEQPKEHSFDVLEHCLAAVSALDAMLAEPEPTEQLDREIWRCLRDGLDHKWLHEYLDEEVGSGASRQAILKLGCLLHDVGKPETKTLQPDGRTRFFGHSEAGARIAGGLMRRLRFSSRETAIVKWMIEAHLRPLQMAQSGAPTRRAIYRFFRDTGDAGIETLILSLADHAGTVGPRLDAGQFRRHVALVDFLLKARVHDEEVIRPPRLLSGNELAEALGAEEGPILGRVMEAVREAQAAGEVNDKEGAVSVARREFERLRESAP